MAKILGKSGRYVSEQSSAKIRQMWRRCILAIAGLGLVGGFAIGRCLPIGSVPAGINISVSLLIVAAIVWIYRSSTRKIDQLDREKLDMRRGMTGEVAVGHILGGLSDDFRVVNDLTTPFGNLDHIVIGPTGVFVIDTKNWRGIVSPDGNGELLLNGQPTDKPVVRQFVARVMDIRERVHLIARSHELFFQPLFVFTSARVEASFGTTKALHCVREDRLIDYILNSRFAKKLQPQEAEKIARAFSGLAHMDSEFVRNPAENQPVRVTTR